MTSCATYYQVNQDFNDRFEFGELEKANKILDSHKKQADKKARFLYFANKGVVESLLGNFEESNRWLERAYLFGEDHRKNAANVAASFLVNPNTMVYPGEDHEHLFVLYYKALNFLKMQQYEQALVECRRLNNRLQTLSDKYRSENKYREDAFIHNLMGIIYEADGDYNNAFIAYRNAVDIYEKVYEPMFGLEAPEQLKKDLIHAAWLTGFEDEARKYQNSFNMPNEKPGPRQAELVFFWHNGLGPVKDEWSITFTTGGYSAGTMTFVDQNTGRVYRCQATAMQATQLSDLSVVRLAFPKYNTRPPRFVGGELQKEGGAIYPLEMAEDVNQIAIKTLEERMVQEIGKGLLRFALKKVVEQQVRKRDENIGMLVSIFNAATEKADTRNWQTLPHSIYYTRVPLQRGENRLSLHTYDGHGERKSEPFVFDVRDRETLFHSYQTLESFAQQP
jgi:hypothetical protein